ncbi:hypothetical protein CAMRE0001_1718 [Campylobacter rectus RM3267]|uniref:Uncharacterized protein n=1 Tax=Campylobacter rectus RM3267 TaxID=553218 RepID=B9CZC7_CAMRE|nr:hypothetical protein CAMRE0001_1718 [Campylobacter rectus RM3267]
MPHPPGFESIVANHKGYGYGKSGNGNKIGGNDLSCLFSSITAFWRPQDTLSQTQPLRELLCDESGVWRPSVDSADKP